MDTNENKEFETVSEEPEVEETIAQVTQEDDSGEYRGAGAGQKESLYDGGTGYIPNTQYTPSYTAPEFEKAAAREPWEQTPKMPNKAQKKTRRTVKRVVAAMLTLVLVAGSCGFTAWTMNNRWEEKTAQMEADFASRIEQIQKELDKTSDAITAGTSVSNTSGMSPSQVYAQNVKAVVAISNYQTASSGWGSAVSQQLASTGSGFVITQDGYVMTNYHVVQSAEKLTVTLYTGEDYEAKLIGYDELNDVAVLKVEAEGMAHVTIGSSDELLVGDMVVAIGNPLGELTSTMTVGYVSGKDRSVSTDGSVINMLQTDAAINSGNSGGPLFNMNGEVIGITTAKYSGSTNSGATIEGIGFAIPIDDVMGMVDDLMTYGYVRNQAYLGVGVISMDSATAAMYNMRTGSYVSEVVEDSCSDRAGVQVGDIIIAIGEYEVDSNNTLQTALRRFSAGDTTTITVYRAGEEVTLDITFDERPQNVDQETTEETQAGEMPDSGSYEEWYDYFFGQGGNDGQP